MDFPLLGELEYDEGHEAWVSDALPLPLCQGSECSLVLMEYEDDAQPADFHVAVANLLAAPFAVLQAVEADIYRYYQDIHSYWEPGEEGYLAIASPADVWQHITFGYEPVVERRHDGDQAVYVSLTCNCDWDREHGLQIVLRNGEQVVKIGPYDGHLTHGDAYDDPTLEAVIYPGRAASNA
ncbi:hypothetical protein SAMN02745857_03605 [Andreprevotia lacus DSM 23236]|jgi:hypothetical protein|uniref:DUF6985 domain-containing protein n=1 Tax=Andreprevotia lacus DSM 23236 TaxID=1121001 RepID=A0A1W1XYV9_9NEIS|nr:hypothetical protein [Andreprevotia lacus]SMC29103.1 hypothetical protein SAMN02745857_03605 [Andreprevotia lacus DSM 23236]